SENYSAGEVEIPLVVVRGAEPGPVLCLVAGIHGDELNGIEIVRRVIDGLQPSDVRGTIIGAPIVNLFGFWNQSRYLPDRRDLNRHFPGRASGSTASRIAYGFWHEVVQRCTHLIDFHTGSLHRSNLPQVRADLSREDVAALALAFGEKVVVHNPGQRHTLRSQAVAAGIAAILYEAGETMRFQKEHITAGVLGTKRVLQHLGMQRGSSPMTKKGQVFLETRWVRAKQGGIVELTPSLGDRVDKGDTVGVITDPLRNAKGVVTTSAGGVVIGKVLAPTVVPGLALLHIGVLNGQMQQSEAGEEELEEERPE
ncbi:MAG: succinylglutamate desuccinylase/aspartoacylase family protein, partial [Myxococcota bacterium]